MPTNPIQPQRGDHGQDRGEAGRQRSIDEVRAADELATQPDEDELDEDDGDEDEDLDERRRRGGVR